MRLKYGNQIHELHFPGGSQSKLIIDDKQLEINSRPINKHEMKINIGDGDIHIYIAEDRKNYFLKAGDEYFKFEKLGDEEFGSEEISHDREEIRSPMPGSIVKVIAREGDTVKSGDAILIIEAMKMESTIYTSINGTVTKMNATEGKQTDGEEILAIIEKSKI